MGKSGETGVAGSLNRNLNLNRNRNREPIPSRMAIEVIIRAGIVGTKKRVSATLMGAGMREGDAMPMGVGKERGDAMLMGVGKGRGDAMPMGVGRHLERAMLTAVRIGENATPMGVPEPRAFEYRNRSGKSYLLILFGSACFEPITRTLGLATTASFSRAMGEFRGAMISLLFGFFAFRNTNIQSMFRHVVIIRQIRTSAGNPLPCACLV